MSMVEMKTLPPLILLKRQIHLHENFPGSMIIAEESTAYGKVSKPIFEGGLAIQ